MLSIPYKPKNIHTGSDQKYILVPFFNSALDVAQCNSVSTLCCLVSLILSFTLICTKDNS